MEADVGISCVLVFLLIEFSLASILFSLKTTSEMLDYAEEQKQKILFSDRIINEYGLYHEEEHSVVAQTVGELPENTGYNVSLRRMNEQSPAEGVVVRRLVFVGNKSKENERVLEIW